MKVLFICGWFAPTNHISSIRPTKIAKYLMKEKTNDLVIDVLAWENTGMAIDRTLLEDASGINNIFNLKKSLFYIYKQRVYETFFGGKKKKLSYEGSAVVKKHDGKCKICFRKFLSYFKSVLNIYLFRIERYFDIKAALKIILKENFDYDAIITFGHNYSDFVGKAVKNKHANIFWIADFRDPIYDKGYSVFVKSDMSYATRVVGKADLVTVVSPGYQKHLYLPNNMKSLVITNGYDNDDLNRVEKKNLLDKYKLNFIYVGSTYINRRDFSIFFKALKELVEEGIVQSNRIVFNYAGNSFDSIISVAQKYELESIINYNGFVSRDISLQLQQSSDVLLLPSWNDIKDEGILPGKFYEYMMINKPIIAIIEGAEQDSVLKSMIDKMSLGFAYERAADSTDFAALKNYIRNIYVGFINNVHFGFNPDKDELKKYSYPYIAKCFKTILLENIKQ